MKAFLNLDLPDRIIDEESTSTPVDFIWEVYKVMLTGQGPSRHVVAASRNTAKTLCAAIIRFYGMVHFRRNGTHLAANLDQSNSASNYLSKFLKIDEVAPFISVNNTREKTLRGLPPNSYTKRDEATLRIAVATVGGVNSQRGSLNTRDELDLVPAAILSEASFISDPTQDEHMFGPVEINLSSRKSNSGPIQALLDEAETGNKPNLMAHKWSLVDWMQRCPDEIHRPDLPKTDAWLNIENLKVIFGQENHDVMTSAEKNLQKQLSVFEGCKTCPAFAVCQGRSAKQTGTQRMLRDINFVGDVIDTVKDPDKLVAQALNWKPESSAVIFRTFNRRRHFLKGPAAWKWLFGEVYNPYKFSDEELSRIQQEGQAFELAKITPTKKEIYQELLRRNWIIHYGVDWGWNPHPSVVVVVAYSKSQERAFVLHVDSANNYANQAWADYIAENVYSEYPCDLTCPDMEDKSSPVYFRKHSIPCLDTKPAKIETGVSQVRGLLWNVSEQVEKLAVLDDGPMGKNDYIANCLEKWTHRKTPLGYDFTKYDKDSMYKDPLDCLRYALHPFIDMRTVKVSAGQPKNKIQLKAEAAQGDQQAISALRQEDIDITRKAMEEHFAEEFGLQNIFKQEDEMKRESVGVVQPESPPKRKSSLKFRF